MWGSGGSRVKILVDPHAPQDKVSKKTLFVETPFCLIEDEIILNRPITSRVARNKRYVQSDKKFIVSCGSKW